MPNIELLNKTLDHIKAHPETWKQSWWVTPTITCGTAYCFAGHAVVLAGYAVSNNCEVDFDTLPEDVRARICDEVYPSDDGDRTMVDVAHTAAGLLDIEGFYTPRQHLFDAGNSLPDLERMVAELCDEAAKAAVR